MHKGTGLDLFSILIHAHPLSKFVFLTLIVCSVWSIAVIIERWIVIDKARKAVDKGVEQLDKWSQGQVWDTAREEIMNASRQDSPLFSVLRAGVSYWQELIAVGETRTEVMEAMVGGAVSRELKLVRILLRARLSVLANIASTAPFIGLFGTVIGIILTFDRIAKTGQMGQELVGSGIADALIATAMGLFAAIPAVLAYNAFTGWINTIVLTMEESAMERIYFLVERHETGGVHAGARN